MKMTANAAIKTIKKLQDEKDYLNDIQEQSSIYYEAEGVEPIIPEYDFKEIQRKIDSIDLKVVKIKHMLNLHNCRSTLPNANITIDAALVRIAQLNNRLEKLNEMRRAIPKKRRTARYSELSTIVEYICVNYNKDDVLEEYNKVQNEIQKIQADIDYCNHTLEFEIDI